MTKAVSVLGSTGSIGTQTLDVVRSLRKENKEIKIIGLSAGRNVSLLEKQIREFLPELVSVSDEADAKILLDNLRDLQNNVPEILYGDEGLNAVATSNCDTLVTAIVGMKGLIPTLKAIDAGKNIALANKETLVVAGEIVTKRAKEKNVRILPVDSEHSAIMQSLMGNNRGEVDKIILTASGGPFRTLSKEEVYDVSIDKVLAHPTWKMGGKITVDCASMMNKGLEVIEAKWLFDMEYEHVRVLVHPQSIIHSMVEYRDGAVIAQLGVPDMKIPIQLALTYPNRIRSPFERLDLTRQSLTFEEPDVGKFPCFKLAREAAVIGGTMTAVLNGANEQIVGRFLQGRARFGEIPEVVAEAMAKHRTIKNPSVEDILEADREGRELAEEMIR